MSQTLKHQLRTWLNSFTDFFPPDPETRSELHWYTPLFRPACSPGEVEADAYRVTWQATLDAAALVRTAQPDALSYATVTAFIRVDDPRWTQVCIFYDPAAYVAFFDRQSETSTWARLGTQRSLARERGLKIPVGFEEFGYAIVHRDCLGTVTEQDELWSFSAADGASAAPVVLHQPAHGGALK